MSQAPMRSGAVGGGVARAVAFVTLALGTVVMVFPLFWMMAVSVMTPDRAQAATVGGNLCNASPAGDSVPAMIAAGAIASIFGPQGKREAPVEDIATGPGKTSLARGEIITSFLLRQRPPHAGDAYLRFTPRTEMDIAVVGVGVNLTLDDNGICRYARVSLGAVAARALLVPAAAAALIGTPVDTAARERLAAAASAACSPIDDKRGTREFRITVAGVLAQRAAEIARARAGGKH